MRELLRQIGRIDLAGRPSADEYRPRRASVADFRLDYMPAQRCAAATHLLARAILCARDGISARSAGASRQNQGLLEKIYEYPGLHRSVHCPKVASHVDPGQITPA